MVEGRAGAATAGVESGGSTDLHAGWETGARRQGGLAAAQGFGGDGAEAVSLVWSATIDANPNVE